MGGKLRTYHLRLVFILLMACQITAGLSLGKEVTPKMGTVLYCPSKNKHSFFNLLRGFIHCKKVSCRILQHSLKQLKQTIFFLLPSASPDGPTFSLTNATIPLQKPTVMANARGTTGFCRCLETLFCFSSFYQILTELYSLYSCWTWFCMGKRYLDRSTYEKCNPLSILCYSLLLD